MLNIYVRSEEADDIRIKNTSGSALVDGDVVAISESLFIANETIASNETGGFKLWCAGQTLEIAVADLVSGEDTFNTPNQAVFFDSALNKVSDTEKVGYYRIGFLQIVKSSSCIVIITTPAKIVTEEELGSEFVSGTGVLTAAAAATPVNVIPASKVPAGKKFYPLGMILSVGGATAWTDATATVVKLQDTAASPVALVSVAKAQLTGNAVLGFPSTGVTLQTPVRTGVGATAAKGVDVVADAVFGAGSDISVTVFGVVK